MRNNKDLFIKAQNGDEQALEELYSQNKPLVTLELKREMAVRNLNDFDYEDLEQELDIALLNAIKRFDTEKGYQFSTFAGNYLKNTRNTIRNKNKINKLCSTDLGICVKVNKIQKEEFMTKEEAYEKLGISEEVKNRIENMNKGFYSMESELDFDSAENVRLGDILPCKSDTYLEIEQKLIIDRMFKSLSDRDRKIVYLQFYDGLTYKQIGTRLGISDTQVGRIIRRSLVKMKQSYFS